MCCWGRYTCCERDPATWNAADGLVRDLVLCRRGRDASSLYCWTGLRPTRVKDKNKVRLRPVLPTIFLLPSCPLPHLRHALPVSRSLSSRRKPCARARRAIEVSRLEPTAARPGLAWARAIRNAGPARAPSSLGRHPPRGGNGRTNERTLDERLRSRALRGSNNQVATAAAGWRGVRGRWRHCRRQRLDGLARCHLRPSYRASFAAQAMGLRCCRCILREGGGWASCPGGAAAVATATPSGCRKVWRWRHMGIV